MTYSVFRCSLFYIFFLGWLLLSSCTIHKNLNRRGYNLSWGKNQQHLSLDSEELKDPEEAMQSIVVCAPDKSIDFSLIACNDEQILNHNSHQFAYLDLKPKNQIQFLRDSLKSMKRNPTYRQGKKDARRYYKLKHKKNYNNPKNPRNAMLSDQNYNAGYRAGAKAKKTKLLVVLLYPAIAILALFLALAILSIGYSGGSGWL